MNISICRKIFATFLRNEGVEQEFIDLLQGRISKSVFVMHYYRPDSSKFDEIRKKLANLHSLLLNQLSNDASDANDAIFQSLSGQYRGRAAVRLNDCKRMNEQLVLLGGFFLTALQSESCCKKIISKSLTNCNFRKNFDTMVYDYPSNPNFF